MGTKKAPSGSLGTKPEVIRVLLAEDHVVVRDGLAAIINQEKDMEVVAEAGEGGEAVNLWKKHRPDVTLMDLRMPGLSGANAIYEIHEVNPEVRIIVLTTFDGDEDIGLELSQAMRRFGSEVTIVERNGHLAHREDEDVTQSLEEVFRDEGITVATNTKINRVEGKVGEWVKLHCTRDGVDLVLEGTHLLVAGGRTPNTGGIGLELAGVETTERGFVKVNERLQTTADGTWAIGDCAGNPHFTHISFDDFRVVRDNISGGNHVTTGRQVPYTLFTDPELAHIGLSEREAKERGITYRLAKIPMMADLRTRTLSETRGFMKVLVDSQSEQILGFTMFGVMAGEVMATVQVAMLGNMPYTTLRDAVFTHPTMLEGLIPLFSAVPPKT